MVNCVVTSVQVTALDLDLNPQLEYFIIEVLAYDDANAIVPNQSNVFAIDFTTGLAFLSYTKFHIDYIPDVFLRPSYDIRKPRKLCTLK